MNAIEAKLRQAEEQLAFWRQKAEEAQRQALLWEGAVAALRGVVEEAGEEASVVGGGAGGAAGASGGDGAS